MSSPGFGDRKQLAACGHCVWTGEHGTPQGLWESQPHCSGPQHRDVAASQNCPSRSEFGRQQVRQGQWQSKSWENWERGGCFLCSLHWGCFWWPAAQWEVLVYILFFSHLKNFTGMRFWAFTSLSVLFCNMPWKQGRKRHIAIFILLQFSSAGDLEQKSFTSQ